MTRGSLRISTYRVGPGPARMSPLCVFIYCRVVAADCATALLSILGEDKRSSEISNRVHYYEDRRTTVPQQYIHDFRLVRAFEGAISEAVDSRCANKLGHRIVRVPVAGPGQSYWLHGVQFRAVENPARGHHPLCVRALCILLSEGAT